MSAWFSTSVNAVDESLAGFGSSVVVLALAVLDTVVLFGTLAATDATTTKLAVAPAGSVATVSLIELRACASGNAGPAACGCERNDVPAGNVSVNETAWASLGP